MAGTQAGADGKRARSIAFCSSGGSAQKLVRDFGHGADHNHGALSGGHAARDDGGRYG